MQDPGSENERVLFWRMDQHREIGPQTEAVRVFYSPINFYHHYPHFIYFYLYSPKHGGRYWIHIRVQEDLKIATKCREEICHPVG